MAKQGQRKRKGRRSRLKTASEKQSQLREIELAQKISRQGKIRVKVDSIEKSKQRFLNSLREIRNADDAIREFE